MKFKVGDRVRYDRDFLIDTITTRDYYRNSGLRGFKIVQIEGEEVRSEDGFWFHESHLELVPEEPEFEYGEEVEVKDDCDSKWYKAIFIGYIPGADKNPKYMTVSSENFEKCKKHEYFTVGVWEYARKLRPQLTRKEIAEKFGVSEDFTLIE